MLPSPARGRPFGASVPASPQPAQGVRAAGGEHRGAGRDRRHRADDRALHRARAPLVVRDPRPILWNLLWKAEADWLPFLVLLTVLVFWRNRLYGHARAARGRRADRALGAARDGARARLRDRHRPALHHVRPLPRGGDRDRDDDQPAPLELRDADRVADAVVRRPPAGAARRRRRTRSRICATRSARAAAGSTTSSRGTCRSARRCSRRCRPSTSTS